MFARGMVGAKPTSSGDPEAPNESTVKPMVETENIIVVKPVKPFNDIRTCCPGRNCSTVPLSWTHMPGEALPHQLMPHLSAQMWDEFLTQLTSEVDAARKYQKYAIFCIVLLVVGIVLVCIKDEGPGLSSALKTVMNICFFLGAFGTTAIFGLIQKQINTAQTTVEEEWKPKFATAGLTLELKRITKSTGRDSSTTITWFQVDIPLAAEQEMEPLPVISAVVVSPAEPPAQGI